MNQQEQSEIVFNERDCKAVIGELSHASLEIKKGILKSIKDLLKKDLAFAVKRPENQILNVLVFLQLQILKNKYTNKQNVEQFNKTLRNVFGLVYFTLLKGELKKYQKIFDESIENGRNPLEEICLDLYITLTRDNRIAILEATIMTTYFANIGNTWELVEKAFYNNQNR